MCFSADDELLYVTEWGNHRVQVLRFADGAHVRMIGSKGKRDAQFSCPYDVCVCGAFVLVADCENQRVQVLTLEGEHVRTIASGGAKGRAAAAGGQLNLNTPSAVCVTPAGHCLFVVERNCNRVRCFSS